MEIIFTGMGCRKARQLTLISGTWLELFSTGPAKAALSLLLHVPTVSAADCVGTPDSSTSSFKQKNPDN